MSKILLEHQDYVRPDGKIIPSVTTILKILNKPELVDWANYMGYKGISTKRVTEESAVTGSITHFLIERKCKKKIVPLYLARQGKYPEQVLHCYGLFKRWRKKYSPIFLYNELKVQTLQLGGTIDCICKIDEDVILLDFKTSKDIYPSMYLQLAAYYMLLLETKPHIAKMITKVAVLTLPKNSNNYKYILMDIEHLKEYYVPAYKKLYDFYIMWSDNLKFDWRKKI